MACHIRPYPLLPETRKMCWVAWDKLTLPKSAGGLGFREIEVFNDALLAKHTWRLLKNPSSLLGQTLLNKYCLHEDLLTVSAPKSASHGWRGLLAGREILRKGLGWVVGNGESIRIWQDNWLATNKQLCPMGPPTLQSQNLLVKDLMLPNSTDWCVSSIQRLVPQYETLIRKLVPGSVDMQDERVWLLEKSGEYTTKSGYAMAKIHKDNPRDTFDWKKGVWNVKCSPKLRHFLWKLKSNALAVGDTLIKRGIQTEGKCKRCGERETVLHVMYTCPFAQRVWNLAPALQVPPSTACQSLDDVLRLCTRMINLPPLGLATPLYPWILWVLWTSRNQLLFEDKSFLETEVMVKAIKAAKEWQSAIPPVNRRTASPKDCHDSNIRRRGMENATIVYSDAAWIKDTCAGGLGWSCQDSSGYPLFEGYTAKYCVGSVLIAEAMTLKQGLSMAVSFGLTDVVCASDSKSLIDLLTGNKSVTSIKGILHDIDVLSRSLASISFCFVPRSCNEVADKLAKDALASLSNNPVGVEYSVSVV